MICTVQFVKWNFEFTNGEFINFSNGIYTMIVYEIVNFFLYFFHQPRSAIRISTQHIYSVAREQTLELETRVWYVPIRKQQQKLATIEMIYSEIWQRMARMATCTAALQNSITIYWDIHVTSYNKLSQCCRFVCSSLSSSLPMPTIKREKMRRLAQRQRADDGRYNILKRRKRENKSQESTRAGRDIAEENNITKENHCSKISPEVSALTFSVIERWKIHSLAHSLAYATLTHSLQQHKVKKESW